MLYLRATRPAFLVATLVAVLIGLATAAHQGVPFHPGAAAATLLFALVAHAGINVFNDYYDALGGTDAINVERVHPFTGGSRFIQDGVLTTAQTALFGAALFAAVAAAGLWLALRSSPGLLAVGAAGLLLGWGYTAPPLKLVYRGLGEPTVWIGMALIALGSDVVQRGAFSVAPVWAVASYGLLTMNLLFINEFPDRRADAATGKRHWVVMLGPRRASRAYVGFALAAHGVLVLAVALGALPAISLVALVTLVPSLAAARRLLRDAEAPSRLAPAIRATIAAACAHGALVAAALALSAPA